MHKAKCIQLLAKAVHIWKVILDLKPPMDKNINEAQAREEIKQPVEESKTTSSMMVIDTTVGAHKTTLTPELSGSTSD